MLILAALLLVAAADSTPQGPRLVVVNKDASTVSVIDVAAARILTTLPTGSGPHEVAASRNGRWAVVTDYGAQIGGRSLTIVDLDSLRVARTISLADYERPHGIAFLPDDRTVVVTAEASGVVVLVDVERGVVYGDHATGQDVSHMVATSPDGSRAYTANIGSGSLSQIEIGRAAPPRTLRVAPETEALTVDPSGAHAWVGSNRTGRVYIVDLRRWSVIDSVQTAGQPYRIHFTPDGMLALITNPGTDEMLIVEARTRRAVGRVRIAPSAGKRGRPQPFGIAVSDDGRTAWVSLRGTGEVVEIDLASRTVRRHLPAGAGADGIAFVRAKPAR